MANLRELVTSLQGLAEVNGAEFREDPSLRFAFERALGNTLRSPSDPWRLHWVPDRKTQACARPNCWSPWSSLVALYPLGPVQIDCKGLASTYAALLRANGKQTWVGIRPGDTIAHALCGTGEQKIGKRKGPATLFDPSVTAGMPPLESYAGPIVWSEVKP